MEWRGEGRGSKSLGRAPEGGNMRETARNDTGWVGNFKKEEKGRHVADNLLEGK